MNTAKRYIASGSDGQRLAVGDDATDLDALLRLAERHGGSVEPENTLVGASIAGVRANSVGLHGARDQQEILGSADVIANRYSDLARLQHEVLVVIGIGADMRVVCEKVIRGGQSAVTATMRDIFREVLAADARGVILVHNHPSGRKEPSQADIAYTARTDSAGQLLGVKLVDHVIVSTGGWSSWRLHWMPAATRPIEVAA